MTSQMRAAADAPGRVRASPKPNRVVSVVLVFLAATLHHVLPARVRKVIS